MMRCHDVFQRLKAEILQRRLKDNIDAVPLEGRTHTVTDEQLYAVDCELGGNRLFGYDLILENINDRD